MAINYDQFMTLDEWQSQQQSQSNDRYSQFMTLDDWQKEQQEQENKTVADSALEFADDTGRLLASGSVSAAQNIRELEKYANPLQPIKKAADWASEKLTGQSISGWLEDKLLGGYGIDSRLEDSREYWREGLSNEQKAAMEKDWWDDEAGWFGPAWEDPRAYWGGAVESMPEMVLTMGPSMKAATAVATGAYRAALAKELASGATEAAAKKAASTAAAKSAERAAWLVGGAAEGSLAGAATSREVRDQINALDDDVLMQSEAIQALIAQDMSLAEAKEALANDMATRAFAGTAILTGVFGGMGDRALAGILTDGVDRNVIGRIVKGGFGEGVLEEFPQSAGQSIVTNLAVGEADESRGAFDGTLNEALGGLATGAAMGGALGGVARPQGNRGADPGNMDDVAAAANQPLPGSMGAPMTPAEVAQYAQQREQELRSKPDLQSYEQTELEAIREAGGDVDQLADMYAINVVRDGVRDQAKANVEPLTPDDEASPIPNELIQGGREEVADSGAVTTANSLLKNAGIPVIGSTIPVRVNGQTVQAEIQDAYDEDGKQGAILSLPDGSKISKPFSAIWLDQNADSQPQNIDSLIDQQLGRGVLDEMMGEPAQQAPQPTSQNQPTQEMQQAGEQLARQSRIEDLRRIREGLPPRNAQTKQTAIYSLEPGLQQPENAQAAPTNQVEAPAIPQPAQTAPSVQEPASAGQTQATQQAQAEIADQATAGVSPETVTATQGTEATETVQPASVLTYTASGAPFKTRKSAELSTKARKGGYEAVEVDGGFALKPVQSAAVASEAPKKDLPKGTTKGGPDEIKELVAFTKADKTNAKRSVYFADVSDGEAERIKESTGLDIKGYRRVVDSFGVRHAIKNHGNDKSESDRGQQGITESDFAKIPEIISNPDSIRYVGKDKLGRDLIEYKKRFNGTTYYTEEVRTKRGELATKTLRKTRTVPGASGPAEPAVPLTSETISRNPSQDDSSVLQDGKDSQTDSDEPRFKRSTSGKGMTQQDAQSITDEVTASWSNAPKVNVVQSVDGLPKPIYDYADSVGALGDVRAVYWKGEMHFVADRFADRKSLEEAVLHEGIGHYGVRALFGKDIEPYLERVYLAMARSYRAKEIKARYFDAKRPFDAGNKKHRMELAEELLAHMAESGKHRNLWNKIVSFIRDALRRMNFTLQINDKDLLAILREAEAVVRDGGISRMEGAPAMRRDDNIDLFHTSPDEITKINKDGRFGTGLFFSSEPYVMTGAKNPKTYRMSLSKDDVIDVGRFFYHEDSRLLQPIVEEISERFDVDQETAEALLSQEKTLWETESNLDPEDIAEADWDMQKYGLEAAKLLGYRAAEMRDEQGTSYLVDMEGREQDLIDQSKQDPAMSRLPATIEVNGVERPTTNSDGKPIHPTEEGVRNFWKWFGDSKVVDEQGRPLVVYHGTTGDIESFDKNQMGSNTRAESAKSGFFFTSDTVTAESYANYAATDAKVARILEAADAAEARGDWDGYDAKLVEAEQLEESLSAPANRVDGQNIVAAFASLQDPLVVNAEGENAVGFDIAGAVKKAKTQGRDGVVIYNLDDAAGLVDRESTHVVAFNPNQIKSAIGNTGAFSPDTDDIRFRRGDSDVDPEIARQVSTDRGESLARTLFDKAVFRFQDKFNYLYKAQKKVEAERGAELTEAEDAYLAELRYHGQAGAAIEDFQREYVDPLVKQVSESGLTIDEVDKYLHARHAPEANAQLARVNPDREDNQALSGMSNEEAERIIDQFRREGKIAGLHVIGRKVNEITKMRRDLLRSSGLETDDVINKWEETYKHYVPLYREESALARPGKGKGFSVTGKEKRRAGSNRAVTHILAHVVAQYETTAIRAEKNKVAKAMLNFAMNNPNPDLYEVDKVEYQATFDSEGLVVYRPQKEFALADNVMVVKDDGVDRTITFNKYNDQAMKMAYALKNLGAEHSGTIANVLSRVTRYLAVINTGANPEFIISNFVRDLQTAGYNLSSTEADKMKWKIIKDVGKAWRGIRSFQKGSNSEWAKHFDEFRKAGAQTGWLEFYADISAREKKLINSVEDLRDGNSLLKVKRGLKAVWKFIEDENTAVENAIRLSAFVHARHNGVSVAKSARLAKELTVNFNRKGDYGQVMNSLYLFYNASIQGSVRLLLAAKHKKVQKLIGATVVAAMFLDIINRAIGGDDEDDKPRYDKIPDHVKERNLIIMLPSGSGDYIKIPLPWGYNVFHVMGQVMGEAMTKRGFKPTEGASRVAGSIFGAFNPIGGGTSIAQTLSPTIGDPFVQWAENKDWAGRPLRPEGSPFDIDKPMSQQYWNSVREPSRWVAEQLNSLTGGDSVRPGMIDVSPEAIDLAIDFLTGGIGRFAADITLTPAKWAQGETVESYEVPLLRKVYGKPGISTTIQEFHRNKDDVRLAQKQYEHYIDTDDAEKAQEVREEYADQLALVRDKKATERAISRIKKEIKRVQNLRISDDDKKSRIDALREQERKLMMRFNKRYNDLIL